MGWMPSSAVLDEPASNPFYAGLAQLETQSGAKTIKGPKGQDSNNLYNIKGPGFAARDKVEGSNDQYATYESPAASTAALHSLIQRKYPDAAMATTPEAFAAGLVKGGYATDKDYASKLIATIKGTTVPSPAPQTTKWMPSSAVVDEEKTPVEPPAVQEVAPTPETSFASKIGAFAQGIGKGVTGGLSVYPQALANMAGNVMIPGYGGAQNTLTANLADARAQNEQTAADNPLSYGGGQLAGGLALGTMTGGAGFASTVPRLAATGAAIGGAQGFSERAYTTPEAALADTGIGATVGAGLNVAVPWAAAKFAKSKLLAGVKSSIKNNQTAQNILATNVKNTMSGIDTTAAKANKSMLDDLSGEPAENFFNSLDTSEKVGVNALRDVETATAKRLELQENNDYLKKRLPVIERTPALEVMNSKLKTLGGTPRDAETMPNADWTKSRLNKAMGVSAKDLVNVSPIAGLGALGGIGQALYTGNNPWMGALTGAGLATGARSLGTITAARLGTTSAAGALRGPVIEAAASAYPSYDDYIKAYDAEPDPAKRIQLGNEYAASLKNNEKPTSRLTDLAERFKAGTQ